MKLKKALAKALAITGVALAGTAAQAAPIEVGDYLNIRLGGSEGAATDTWAPANLHMKVGGTVVYGEAKDPNAGMFDLEAEHAGEGDWQRLLAFCLEPGVAFAKNNPFVVVDNVSNDLRRMWGTYFGSVNTSTEAAAFQIAVWELVADAGDYDLSAGNFYMTTPSNAVGQQAAEYLTGWNAWARLVRLQDTGNAGNKQDLLDRSPLPGTLGLLTMGLVALTMLRRKKES